MQPIKITVNATRAVCTERPDPITTGMVGLRAEFTFSADWDGLQKTAVCVGSGVTKDVLDVQDAITVPHECLTDPASELKVGVYGVNSSGDLVIPTVYAYCGRLFRGADPSGDESADPTLSIWAQLLAMMGSLDNLTTTAKENLVAAINEAAKTGGGGGGGTPADVKMQVSGGYIQYSTDGGATWTNLIAMADLIGPAGPAGADGQDGSPGADGQDGITPTIGPNGNWYLGSTDTGKPSRGEVGPAGADGKDGSDGQPGRDGIDGQDGIGIQSVEQTTTSTEDGGTNVVTVTKTDGTSSTFQVKNGSRGSTGPAGADGAAGADGYTPVKGTDYFTETDKQEIAEQAAGMVSIPEKLPNPNALTFTGAVSGTYDGSEPMSVEIPSGGTGGSSEENQWRLLNTVTLTEPVSAIEILSDSDGNPFEISEFVVFSPLGVVCSGNTQLLISVIEPGAEFDNLYQTYPWKQISTTANSFLATNSKSILVKSDWVGGRYTVCTSGTYDVNVIALPVGTVRFSSGSMKDIGGVKLSTQYTSITFNEGTFYLYGR